MTTYSGSQFSWHKGEGAVEASDIEFDPRDRAFFVRSARTGAVRKFSHIKTLHDGDELYGWQYAAAAPDCVITIYND